MTPIKRCLVLHAVCLLPLPCYADVDVLTYNYDNARTGQNVHERVLSPTSVPNLEKLFSFKVAGDRVLAQPLYMHDLEIPGWGTHDVLFVATEGDKVFAFDADNSLLPYGSPLLWEADLLSTKHGAAAGESTVPSNDISCTDYGDHVGITGTPVIDRATHTLYVVSKSKSSGSWINRLHVLDILNGGAEKRGSPVAINLDPSVHHNNHAALLLEHGRVYVAFASHCDTTPYHGTVIAFDARTLRETHRFVTTDKPAGRAGIWMAGSGPAADAQAHIYIVTGNGDPNNPGQFDNSIIKLNKNLRVADYFTACDTGPRNSIDRDLGLGGVVLLPEQPAPVPHLLVQAGKVGSGTETKPDGTIYVLDRDRMTTPGQHRVACNTTPPVVQENPNIWQDIPKAVGNVNAPAYWNQSVYIRGADGAINRYNVSGSKLILPSEKSSEPNGVNFVASISISADRASNGVVWAENNDPATSDVVLRAYDALTLKLLYSSDTNPTRDTPGTSESPFGTPVVADGKVYVGVDGEVAVYGIPKTSCSHGPDQCRVGYVWRDAYNSPVQGHDHVCVTEAERTEVQSDNLLADKRRSLNGGPYGRNTCLDGFVWREANPLDQVCVTRETRSETGRQNREAFEKVDPMCRTH